MDGRWGRWWMRGSRRNCVAVPPGRRWTVADVRRAMAGGDRNRVRFRPGGGGTTARGVAWRRGVSAARASTSSVRRQAAALPASRRRRAVAAWPPPVVALELAVVDEHAPRRRARSASSRLTTLPGPKGTSQSTTRGGRHGTARQGPGRWGEGFPARGSRRGRPPRWHLCRSALSRRRGAVAEGQAAQQLAAGAAAGDDAAPSRGRRAARGTPGRGRLVAADAHVAVVDLAEGNFAEDVGGALSATMRPFSIRRGAGRIRRRGSGGLVSRTVTPRRR
jgi:hypothetical protein